MYSRLVICLAGLRHPIRLVAQDIAFMVGGAGIEPAEPKHLIYSQARCPLRNTHRYAHTPNILLERFHHRPTRTLADALGFEPNITMRDFYSYQLR